MRFDKQTICRMANRLVKEGVVRSEAFKRAWCTAKRGLIEKVVGVTYGSRQKLLAFLDNIQKERIDLWLYRDRQNTYDAFAVAVIAVVPGYGQYRVGYLPKQLSVAIGDLMDKGVHFTSVLQGIVGGYNGKNYGMRIKPIIGK